MNEKIVDYKKAYEESQAQIALLSSELKRVQEQLNYYIKAHYKFRGRA